MMWRDLRPGDVLIDVNQHLPANSEWVILLILVPPSRNSHHIEYISLLTGKHVTENMVNSTACLEDDWHLMRSR